MPLELSKQVTSRELSERLKALGVKQESLYFWEYSRMTGKWTICTPAHPQREMLEPDFDRGFSAFTASELGEMLIKTRGEIPTTMFRNTVWMNGKWWATMDTKNDEPAITADTEAEARGLMLEYLIKSGIIKL